MRAHPLVVAVVVVAACSSAPRPTAPARPRLPAAGICPPALASPDVFPVELAANRRYLLGAPMRMTPTEDGRLVLFLRATPGEGGGRNALWETDIATGKSRSLLQPETVLGGATELL